MAAQIIVEFNLQLPRAPYREKITRESFGGDEIDDPGQKGPDARATATDHSRHCRRVAEIHDARYERRKGRTQSRSQACNGFSVSTFRFQIGNFARRQTAAGRVSAFKSFAGATRAAQHLEEDLCERNASTGVRTAIGR